MELPIESKTNIFSDVDYNLKSQFDNNSLSLFFKESKSIIIKNYIYIFPLYKSEYKYAVIDLENNQLIFQEMPCQCFLQFIVLNFIFPFFYLHTIQLSKVMEDII